MEIHKLGSGVGFVAVDFDDAEVSSGPVRWAKKILQGGAQDLARSQTYTYAALGMRRGGASAGISAPPDERAGAIDKFVADVTSFVANGVYLPDAAKGVSEADLAPLRANDPRDTQRLDGEAPTLVDRCEGLGVAVAAEKALGGLDGRTVAIEGFGATGPSIAAAVAARGGTVTAVSTTKGTATIAGGADPAALAAVWSEHGESLVEHLDGEPGGAWEIFKLGADVLMPGSKMGAVNHQTAEGLDVKAVVPSGRLPLTARALAVLRKADVAALPDFVTLAGSTLALWGDENRTDAEIEAGVVEEVGDLIAAAMEHEDGPLLGACHGAEDFIRQWRPELPFGRPLAP